MDSGGGELGLFMLALILFAYFTPTFVASVRGRDGSMMIMLLNIFLGWTVIGWLILLIVAFTGESAATRKHRAEELALLRKMAANQRPPAEQ